MIYSFTVSQYKGKQNHYKKMFKQRYEKYSIDHLGHLKLLRYGEPEIAGPLAFILKAF